MVKTGVGKFTVQHLQDNEKMVYILNHKSKIMCLTFCNTYAQHRSICMRQLHCTSSSQYSTQAPLVLVTACCKRGTEYLASLSYAATTIKHTSIIWLFYVHKQSTSPNSITDMLIFSIASGFLLNTFMLWLFSTAWYKLNSVHLFMAFYQTAMSTVPETFTGTASIEVPNDKNSWRENAAD